MATVRIELHEGRGIEVKRRLVRDVTDAVSRNLAVDAAAVSVALDEYPGENRARAGVLDVDRAARAMSDYESSGSDTADLVVVAEQVPAELRTLPGTLFAERDDGMTVSLHATRSGAGLQAILAELSRAGVTTTTACVRVDLPQGGGLDGDVRVGRYMTMSTHTVRPEVVEEYLELRRVAVQPDMGRMGGFISSDLLRKVAQPNAFFVVNQWLSREHAVGYETGPVHDWLKPRVRPLLADHSGARAFTVLTSGGEA